MQAHWHEHAQAGHALDDGRGAVLGVLRRTLSLVNGTEVLSANHRGV
ncbi:hypothetical protein ACFV19_06915 [Streptomyces griseoluteus]